MLFYKHKWPLLVKRAFRHFQIIVTKTKYKKITEVLLECHLGNTPNWQSPQTNSTLFVIPNLVLKNCKFKKIEIHRRSLCTCATEHVLFIIIETLLLLLYCSWRALQNGSLSLSVCVCVFFLARYLKQRVCYKIWTRPSIIQ